PGTRDRAHPDPGAPPRLPGRLRPRTGTIPQTGRRRWSGGEVDRGEVVVGVPAGGGVPPAGEQRAGEGERGAAGLRGMRGELGVLEGVLEGEGGAEVPGQHAA